MARLAEAPTPFQTGWFEAADGTRLAYQSVGRGPTVVLANGLGGTFTAWRRLYERLAPYYRVVSWDYRGLHASDTPRNPDAIDVRHHVDDLEALITSLRVDRAVFLGWSMGTQVNFELYRRQPERFVGLGVINGTAGLPFESLPLAKLTRHVGPRVLRAMAKRGELVNVAAKAATAWPGFVKALKRVGVIAPTLDEQVFADLAVEFGRLDFGLYLDVLRRLGEHDAWDVLPGITVPTTIITGSRDPMTPVSAATRMAQLIPDARLVVIPDCTHYTPIEQPDLVNRAIDRLLERSKNLALSRP